MSISGQNDLSIVNGEPFTSTVNISICSSGGFNLSGYAVTGGIKYSYVGPNLADFTVTINSPLSGILTIDLTSGQTYGLPVTECIYYLKAIPSGGGQYVDLLNGYANVYPL